MTHNGKQTALPVTNPKDEMAAFAAFQALLERAKATPVARPEPVASLIGEYLDSISHRISEKTRRDYGILLNRLIACMGNRAASELDASTVEKSAVSTWSDSHKANYLYACQAFLRWCGLKDLKLHRPAKESRGDSALIPPEVYARVLRETHGDLHQFCRLLWLTGARPMEAAGLRAEMIDWTGGLVVLKQHKTRQKGKRRVIYLPAEALAVLREQVAKYGSGLLFRGQNWGPLTRRALVGRFLRLSKKIGHRVRAYDFRHTFITRSLLAGVPAATVAALVGNSIGMIEKFYGHIGASAAPLREAAERAAG